MSKTISLEEAYLVHLKLYIESGDTDSGLFRTLCDGWFAHHKGGAFLRKSGWQVWFNKPDVSKTKDALLQMHFISSSAREAIESGSQIHIVKDHSIPLKVLKKILSEKFDNEKESLKDDLMKFYRLGVITKAEDEKLNKLKLRSKMPENWKDLGWKARYIAAGIS